MQNLSNSRREFLRQALGLTVVASTSPLVVLGKIIPSLSESASGQIVATYVIKIADYPPLATVDSSVRLMEPDQLLRNPDHVRRAFTGKDFPIAITRVAETGADAFKAVSTYCSHGADYSVKDFNPITGEFVCPHKGSSFMADGTHIPKANTPLVGDLRKFPAVYDEEAGTITLDKVLEVADVRLDGDTPAALFLDQNYPNPFNPTTLIRFGLPRTSHVLLTVFTLDGAPVAVILDEERAAGTYVADFSGAGLASGTYFYQLRTNHGTLTRRMTLRK